MKVTLIGRNDSLEVFVNGPFYNDPLGPDDGEYGKPYWELWNYEGKLNLLKRLNFYSKLEFLFGSH